MRRLTATLICLLFAAPAWADDVSRDFLLRYNEVALKAEQAFAKGGTPAAIRVYEEALLTDAMAGYGRIHLRLGKLYRDQGRNPEAASHFRACRADDRVDQVDRDLICLEGFNAVTAPLTIAGLPDRGEAIVIEPRLFAGPFRSGDRLPLGNVQVMVEAPGREAKASTITLDGPETWQAVVGLSRRAGPLVPDGFVGDEGRDDDPFAQGDPFVQADPFLGAPPDERDDGAVRWPAYTALGVGLAMVAGGVTLGYLNRGELDDIRAMQRAGECATFCGPELAEAENQARLADGLWIGGAAVAASSIALWFLFDAPAPAEAP